jgi:hypothetical protein
MTFYPDQYPNHPTMVLTHRTSGGGLLGAWSIIGLSAGSLTTLEGWWVLNPGEKLYYLGTTDKSRVLCLGFGSLLLGDPS